MDAKAETRGQNRVKPSTDTSDLTPQIAKERMNSTKQRSRKDGPAVQDWEKAEREIRKDEIKDRA